MRYLLLTTLVLTGFFANTQTTFNKFQWKSSPVLHKIDAAYSDDAAVYVNDKKIIEYVFEKEGFYSYKTVHKIIQINNDKGIEYFNKIYLPIKEGLMLVDVKARTILPNGKIINFDEKNIKDIKENGNDYKIFALDGLIKGCEVEYYYTIKNYPSFFGREILSSNFPVISSGFDLITPSHLVFESKTYNNLPVCKDTIMGEKRFVQLYTTNIPAAEDEKYSMSDASKKRIEYKLSYNIGKNAKERLFTWNELANKVYDIYSKHSEKELKRVKEYLSAIGVKEAMSNQEKIIMIERDLKKNFINREDISDDDAVDLVKVIKNKTASNKAVNRLYCAAFTAAKVDYQVVLLGDRETFSLDKNFENWNNANNFLIYFPGTSKYIAPTETFYRYPWFPPTWAGTNGLFCINTTIGNFTTAIAEMRVIQMEAYEKSYLNMEMKLAMDNDNDAVLVDVKQLYGGYSATNYKIPFIIYPADDQKQFLKELVKFGTNSEDIISSSLENKELDQKDPYLPFIIQAKVRSTKLVEKAGEKIIVRIGDLIGQQVQMYDTKERNNLIDVGYPHALVRTIELTIPDGYEIKNLNDLVFNEVYKEKDKITMGFVCNYKIDVNKLKITVQEDYVNCIYPIDQYEIFKKIINAAADFNKVVLVLDKKN